MLPYVAWHRFTLKSGIEKVFPQQLSLDDLLQSVAQCAGDREISGSAFQDADKSPGENWIYIVETVGNPPNWFLNPSKALVNQTHWADIADFEGGIGDIKNVWRHHV